MLQKTKKMKNKKYYYIFSNPYLPNVSNGTQALRILIAQTKTSQSIVIRNYLTSFYMIHKNSETVKPTGLSKSKKLKRLKRIRLFVIKQYWKAIEILLLMVLIIPNFSFVLKQNLYY